MRYVLLGDAESPHLLKWARALVAVPPIELWVASSRGFAPGFDAVVPAARRLALRTRPRAGGDNLGVLRHLPVLARWLKQVDAAWIHAHYLTSHGTLAWLAQRWFGVGGRLVASAWGSDILVTPQRSAVARVLTRQVLRACVLATSDSKFMATRMRALGAAEVMVFPFGLEALPPPPGPKDDDLFFANRGLEPLYDPQRVLAFFQAATDSHARLVVANGGSLKATLQDDVEALGLGERVCFVGWLDAAAQAAWYAKARWYISLPRSDSVAVSVLEAMGHGCVPLLSDLPANRELVRDGDNGLIVTQGASVDDLSAAMKSLLARADSIATDNRQWVADHALFAPCVQRFVARLRLLAPAPFAT